MYEKIIDDIVNQADLFNLPREYIIVAKIEFIDGKILTVPGEMMDEILEHQDEIKGIVAAVDVKGIRETIIQLTEEVLYPRKRKKHKPNIIIENHATRNISKSARTNDDRETGGEDI